MPEEKHPFIKQIPSKALKTTAENVLNRFIEALAVMIVTSCVIPILVLFFFVWVTKLILGVDLPPLRREHRL